MVSSLSTSEAMAQPCRIFSFSASGAGVRRPTAMSLVIWLPPSESTAVCTMLPLEKMAMSVVPPPMSISATPRSFSSSLSTAIEDARGWSTRSATSRPVLLAHLIRFWAEEQAPVTMCTLASSRTPLIPRGSLIPSWLSMMNSRGRMWITSRSRGMTTARAASITRRMSLCLTSLSLTATTPWELIPLM